MGEIRKKMRRKAFAGHIIGGLAVVLVSVFLFAVWVSDFTDYFIFAKDLFKQNSRTIQTRTFYKCKNNYILDYYGSDDKGYYCIIPIKGTDDTNTFMGFYVGQKDFDKVEQIMKETWKYNENGTIPSTYLSYRGYVYDMTSTEREYFIDWFEEAKFQQEDIDKLCYKTFVPVPAGEMVGDYFFPVAICTILFLVGVWMVLSYLTGFYSRKVRKTVKERNLSGQQVEYDLSTGEHYKKVDIGKRYTMVYGGTPQLFVNADFVWAYLNIQRTRHMLYGVIHTGTSTTYTVNIISCDGEVHQIAVSSQQAGDEIVTGLGMAAPYMLIGYDEQLMHLKDNNFSEMLRIVDKRKQDLAMEDGLMARFEDSEADLNTNPD